MPEALAGRLSAALSGRYVIERQLGQGGMATVYLADDLRHGRKVALKVLRPELAAVIGAERFLHEIRVTAGLQHPHILPLHDSGEADTFLYYVMPFVEGESLRDRLVRERQLSVEDAVRVATEVAAALSYAHGRGVIHRDIKPENILVASGSAVVADFGIARAVTAAGGGRLTETGLSLGTPQYMSPEQATADRDLDGRSDVYALGCVLYEMLAGEPPYTGPTAQSVIAKLLTEEPRPVTAARPSAPPHIAAAVHRALARLPADRFRSAAEFADALQHPGAFLTASASGAQRAAGLGPRSIPVLVTLLALAVAAVAWTLTDRPDLPPRPLVRSVLALPDEGRLQILGVGTPLALSSDSRMLVYASEKQLYLRPLDQLEATPVAGSEGATQPFFSPNGNQVGFTALGNLMQVSLPGGPPVTICPIRDMAGAAWGPDDTIVFSSGGRLFRVPATGGTPLAIPHDTTRGHLRRPQFLPDGRRILATRVSDSATATVLVDASTGEITEVAVNGMDARFADGFLLTFETDGSGTLTPFDWREGRTTGPPVKVIEGVEIGLQSTAKLALSRDGWVIYAPRVLSRRRLVLVNRIGRETPISGDSAPFSDPRFSPTGREIAVTVLAPTGGLMGEIWVVEPSRATRSRLTFEGLYHFAEWSRDGRRITFVNNQVGLLSVPVGGGPMDSLFAPPGGILEGVPTGDGQYIIYRAGAIPGDLYYTRRDSPAPQPLAVSRFDERAPAISPGDRWVAYVSNETGRDQVYVRSFPGGGTRAVVSSGGGTEPVWSRDGRELFYRNGDTLFAVPVLPGPGFTAGPRKVLFIGHYLSHGRHATYDVHPDGNQFVFVTGDPAGTDEVILVQNLAQRRTAAPR